MSGNDDIFSLYIKADPKEAIVAVDNLVEELITLQNTAARTGEAVQEVFQDKNGRFRDAEGRFVATGAEVDKLGGKFYAASSAVDEMGKKTNSVVDSIVEHVKDLAITLGSIFALHELGAMADEFLGISNKLRVLSDTEGELNLQLDATYDVAQQTRQSWESVANMYQRLTIVTDEYGLSSAQVLNMTREITEAAKIGGATNQEATQSMSELTHAFASGTLQGREFRVLMRDTPALMKELQLASGKTAAEFAEMGKHSKISAQDIIDWLGKADDDIKAKFAKTIPTLSDQWEMFQNEITKTAGEVASSTGIFQAIGGVFHVVGNAVSLVSDALQMLTFALGNTGTAAVGAGAAVLALAKFSPQGAIWTGATIALSAYIDQVKKLGDYLNMDLIWQAKVSAAEASAYESYNKSMGAVIEQYNAILKDIDAHNDLFDAINKVAKAMADGDDIIAKSETAYSDQIDKVNALTAAVNKLRQRNLDAGLAPDSKKILDLGDVQIIRDYVDAQDHLTNMGHTYGAVVEDIHKKENERTRGQQDLRDALAAGAITQAEYTDELKKYTGPLSELQKVLNDINAPQVNFHKTQAALNTLFNMGAISLTQYREALQAAIVTEDQALESRRLPPPSVTGFGEQGGGNGLPTTPIDMFGAASFTKGPLLQAQHDATQDKFGPNSDITKFIADVDELKAAQASGAISIEEYTADLDKLKTQFGAHSSQIEQINQKQIKLNELVRAGAIDQEDYALATTENAKAMEKLLDSGKSLEAGLSRGWHQIRDQITDVASVAAKAMDDAFASMENALVSFVTKGTVDWHSMIESMLADLTRLLERQALMALFSSGAGAAAGAGSLASMPGLANPFAAGGNQWTIGGAGAQDSQVVAFRASPGERVTVDHGPNTGGRLDNDTGMSARGAPVTIHVLNDPKAIVAAMATSEARRVMLSTYQQADRYKRPRSMR